jgi:hypothetical protein
LLKVRRDGAEIPSMQSTPVPAPGPKTSEFKVVVVTIGATVLVGALKVAGVAVLASGQWWAGPVAMALASLGYSLSRGLAKRGVVIRYPGAVTDAEPAKIPGV